uniref:DUF6598 domain-containing protein n=1 Tax=Oryza rufipogon TaxID=4529 RepID=A0A0E0RAH6_ORYRU
MAGREVDDGVVDPASVYYYKSAEVLYESSRDLRHVRKTMDWHLFYNMHVLSPTPLGPMDHWNNCRNKGDGCKEEPYAMLQIFDVKVLPFTLDVTRPVEVYGIIAVRDDVDEYRRNYIFNRSRDNPAYDSLPLMSPTRGMSMAEACLIETDIRIKVSPGQPLFLLRLPLQDPDRRRARRRPHPLDAHPRRRRGHRTAGFPAAPRGGGDFRVRMTGYTRARPSDHHHHPDNTYVFAGDGRELDEIVVRAAGELEHRFVAAVRLGDTLELSFMEEGREPLAFLSAKHDSEVKPYRFQNEALVLVQVSWSVTDLGP